MRKLKPHKVDTIVVARTSVPLYLDRDKLDFFATLGLEEVRDPTIAGLRNQVAKKLRDWKPEVWEEFIAVSSSPPDRDSHHRVGTYDVRHVDITFEFFRGEKAKKLDGAWVQRLHLHDREALCAKAKRDRHYTEEFREHLEKKTDHYWVPEHYVVIPYSEAAWASLCEAERQLRDVRAKIYETVQSKQFLKHLTGTGGAFRMLPGK